MDQTSLQRALAHLPIPQIRWFQVTPSTNDIALAWAAAGAPDGALVAADQQTRGRGRLNREWITWPGSALAFSLVLRPNDLCNDMLPRYALLGGLAVCLALEGLKPGCNAKIKWPNDVLLENHKVCGVLAEAVWSGSSLSALVLGIGVNVLPGSTPPPQSVRYRAGNVADLLAIPVDRLQLLGDILDQLFAWRERLQSQEFLTAWETRLAFRGLQVVLENTSGKRLSGVLEGVSPSGGLSLRLPNGETMECLAGDLSLRPGAAIE